MEEGSGLVVVEWLICNLVVASSSLNIGTVLCPCILSLVLVQPRKHPDMTDRLLTRT